MTNSPKLIRGKVARILSSRELALNIGLEHGVRLDMLFDVLDEASENIRDPDTGEVIGSIYRPKVRVRIVVVQDRLSVASTYRSKNVNIGGTGPSLHTWAAVLAPPKWVREYETLKTEEATWEDIDEEDSYVATGDPVVQVLNDEDGD